MSRALQRGKGNVQSGGIEPVESPNRHSGRGRGRARARAAKQGAARPVSNVTLPEIGELGSNHRPSTRARLRETREVAIFVVMVMQILTFFKWHMM